MGLPPSLQASLLWPINAKKAVTNWHPLGDPQVEKTYHTALEDGRELQKSITDANNWLMQRQKQVMVDIQHLFNSVKIGTDGKFDNPVRSIKYGYDIVNFMQQVAKFEQSIIKLVGALVQNVSILQSMEANILSMVQQNLNAIASLLHEICNWGLPDLPAIPNLFSDGIWNWNGFNFFPLASFIPHPNFDVNFAFGQCSVHVPNVNILQNFPSTVQSYDGLSFGTPLFVPPLGGIIPNTGTNLTSQTFINLMQKTTTTPYYTNDPTYTYPTPQGPVSGTFNPLTSMQGSLPNPNTVISNYQMPPATYAANILSTVPALLPDVVNQVPATLRKDLIQYVTLGAVVASNYDPNLTAAWLLYLNGARGTGGGRAGNWIANFQAAYQTYVQPSLDYLAATPTPWNRVLPGTTLSAGPAAIPLISTITSAAAQAQGNLLWRLSYVEAALLGYARNTTWDAFGDNNYVGSYTGTDLDYATIAISPSTTTTVILGTGTAQFPVPCIFPSAIGNNLQVVIAQGTTEILIDTTFVSSHPQYRFTYDQFAVATQVDRFSQYWREFNGNLQAFLVQDPYLVSFVCAYPDSLASAIDPLGDPTTYNALKADVNSRNRAWVPGFPLLPFPTVPVVVYTNNSIPTAATNGWTGDVLNPEIFLSRPDIQGQPIPVQMAMLKCNQTAAGLMQYQTAITTEFNNAITLAQQAASSAGDFGFQVEVDTSITTVPPGMGGVPLNFDQIDFDLTGYITTQSPFSATIQASGAYVVSGQLNWGGLNETEVGVRTVTVYNNGIAILTASTPNQSGPGVSLPFSETANLNEGDVITIAATHNLPDSQDVIAGSLFSVIMYQSTPNVTPVIPSSSSNGITTFTAAADFPPGTAVIAVNVLSPPTPEAEVVPVDPTTVVFVNTSGPFSPPLSPPFSPPFPYVVYPFIDGVALFTGVTGASVQVATGYGSVFQIPGMDWVPGGLLYAGPGGLITQDFQGTILPNCKWVIVVGRALDIDTFIYEPHIPLRSVKAF